MSHRPRVFHGGRVFGLDGEFLGEGTDSGCVRVTKGDPAGVDGDRATGMAVACGAAVLENVRRQR